MHQFSILATTEPCTLIPAQRKNNKLVNSLFRMLCNAEHSYHLTGYVLLILSCVTAYPTELIVQQYAALIRLLPYLNPEHYFNPAYLIEQVYQAVQFHYYQGQLQSWVPQDFYPKGSLECHLAEHCRSFLIQLST